MDSRIASPVLAASREQGKAGESQLHISIFRTFSKYFNISKYFLGPCWIQTVTSAIFREDANGLPVCVAEGSDGTAELQETISYSFNLGCNTRDMWEIYFIIYSYIYINIFIYIHVLMLLV